MGLMRNGLTALYNFMTPAGDSMVDETANALKIILTNVSGTVVNPSPFQAGTATVTSVNDTQNTGVLVAANSSRIGLRIVNRSTEVLFISYSGTASTANFTFTLAPTAGLSTLAGSFPVFVMPTPIYTGIISGIWSANSTGEAIITELT